MLFPSGFEKVKDFNVIFENFFFQETDLCVSDGHSIFLTRTDSESGERPSLIQWDMHDQKITGKLIFKKDDSFSLLFQGGDSLFLVLNRKILYRLSRERLKIEEEKRFDEISGMTANSNFLFGQVMMNGQSPLVLYSVMNLSEPLFEMNERYYPDSTFSNLGDRFCFIQHQEGFHSTFKIFDPRTRKIESNFDLQWMVRPPIREPGRVGFRVQSLNEQKIFVYNCRDEVSEISFDFLKVVPTLIPNRDFVAFDKFVCYLCPKEENLSQFQRLKVFYKEREILNLELPFVALHLFYSEKALFFLAKGCILKLDLSPAEEPELTRFVQELRAQSKGKIKTQGAFGALNSDTLNYLIKHLQMKLLE